MNRMDDFWGNDIQENTYITTYDGVQYPYDGECKEIKSSGWTVCRLHIRWKNKKIK